jgi:hypothetical protein
MTPALTHENFLLYCAKKYDTQQAHAAVRPTLLRVEPGRKL